VTGLFPGVPIPSSLPLEDSDTWLTPPWILDLVRLVGGDDGGIALDPCPGPFGWTGAKCEIRLDRGQDGLEVDWKGVLDHSGNEGLVYVNPPYGPGHLALWSQKILREAEKGCEVIALLPATPGPEWFQSFAPKADAVLFLSGRPKFHDPRTLLEPDGPGMKDSALFYFGTWPGLFIRTFREKGWAVVSDPRGRAKGR